MGACHVPKCSGDDVARGKGSTKRNQLSCACVYIREGWLRFVLPEIYTGIYILYIYTLLYILYIHIHIHYCIYIYNIYIYIYIDIYIYI
jgi:hypothetical protein